MGYLIYIVLSSPSSSCKYICETSIVVILILYPAISSTVAVFFFSMLVEEKKYEDFERKGKAQYGVICIVPCIASLNLRRVHRLYSIHPRGLLCGLWRAMFPIVI